MSTRPSWSVIAVFACVCATGCARASGRGPSASAPSAAAMTAPRPAERAVESDTSAAWWAAFNSSALDSLVRVALTENADVQLAAARLAEAQATMRGVNANWDPALSGDASFTRSQQVLGNFGAINTSVASLSNSASWELDLFGRLRKDRAAAVADGIASAFDEADVRRTTVAQIARGYVDLMSAELQLAVLEAQLASRQAARALEASRSRAGLSASLDVVRVEAAEREIMSQLPGVRTQRSEAVADLATLTGRPMAWVDALVRGAQDTVDGRVLLRDPLSDVATDVPADQLRARPDVRAAEARVVAAAARVEVARRALLPSLTLGGTVGRNRTNGSAWVPTWSFGPSLALTLPTRAGRAQVRVRRAQLLQREIEWRAAVRDAATDADIARARVVEFRDRVARQRVVVGTYRDLAALAKTRWSSGLTDFRDVIEAERSEMAATRSLVEWWAAYAKAAVTWQQAVGGAEPTPR